MIIGIDFDNTIVNYDAVFRQLAIDLQCASTDSRPSWKSAIQDRFRSMPEGEVLWSELQGEVYGPRLVDATPYPGVVDRLRKWLIDGHTIYIISHKSTYPTLGAPHELRVFAQQWIRTHLGCLNLPPNSVFFEETLVEKIDRIMACKCDWFIDDLESVLDHPDFPNKTCRTLLFKPGSSPSEKRFGDWKVYPSDPLQTSINTPSSTSSRKPATSLEDRIGEMFSSRIRTSAQLRGGINSRVSLIELESGAQLIAKSYPADNRRRQEKEAAFLTLLDGFRSPRLLSIFPDLGVSIFSLLPGRPIDHNQPVPETHWTQCIDFITKIQSFRLTEASAEVGAATDAALSLQDHLAITCRRRNQWLQIARQQEGCTAEWIQGPLEDSFQALARRLVALDSFKRRLATNELILSPSDFGLHNSIQDDAGILGFCDFEYAGWDDPAKTWSDFVLQPRFTPPKSLWHLWRDAITALVPEGSVMHFNERLPFVFTCCSLNWIYIILKQVWNPGVREPTAEERERLASRLEATLTIIASGNSLELS